ncbi:MAG: flagellar biosynthetic protein FliO [Dehalococcoidia bacterium]|nr:flagellar biosynthetic protein FliO [Dehalococcoidia bacterium]
MRWWAGKSTGPRSSTGFLRVVDTLSVGNGRTIHLVALGERIIVVGATQQSLSYLNELSRRNRGRHRRAGRPRRPAVRWLRRPAHGKSALRPHDAVPR